jgi:transposase
MAPETLDSLDADSVKPLVLQLLGRIDELLAQNKTLLARVAELEAKLGQPPKTPTNSSLPPSRGQKANVAGAPRKKKGRRGRPGVARALCPNPDRTREVYADKCVCGAALKPADQPEVFAYDHIDLPPIKPVTTRIHLHKGFCPCCKRRVAARPPADMRPGSPFGPGIVALTTYLHACQMVSYARLVEMLDGVFGLAVSEGAVANMLARASSPLAGQADEIAEIVRKSPVIASDETSARVCGKNHWQWTFVASSAVYHTIQPSRGKAVPVAFLGQAKPDVWVSDRLAAQGNHAAAHQYCLAHLIRDAQYAIDAGDTVFAPAFKSFLQDACAPGLRRGRLGRRRPDLADATIKAHQRRLRRELDRLLALKPAAAAGRHLRDAMFLDARDKLLTFMSRRDIEPTNNASEQALRPSVIFRKVTNGFRSAWGAKVYADICSIVGTGRRAGRSALAALRDALARPANRALA